MEYKTIKKSGFVQEEVKKSRFICYIKRVYTEEEARDFISEIKKEHYKANHNCSAYIIEEDKEIKKASDDGEPSGTAGIPMLKVLENHELTNVCVVVTRYFGGIKLGASGLIRAYAGSVSHAIKKLGIVKIKEQIGLALSLTYSQYQNLATFLKKENLQEYHSEFTETVKSLVFVDREEQPIVEKHLTEFFKGKILISEQGIQEVEIDIAVNE